MSDHITKPYQEGTETSMRPYHSVWLAHWSRSGSKSVNGASNNLSTSGESGEESSQTKKRPLLDGPLAATITGKLDIGSGDVAGIIADNPNSESLTGRSKKRRKERLDSESLPMLNVSQHRGGKLAMNIEQATASQGGDLKFRTCSGSGHKTSSLDGKSQSPSLLAVVPERGKPKKEKMKSKDIRAFQQQHENSNKLLNNKALSISPLRGDETMESASSFIPYGMSNRVPFTRCEQSINIEPSSYLSSKKQVGKSNFHSYSTLFVQETKINQLLDSTQATNALSRQHMRTFLLHNPSSSNLDQPNSYPIHCDTRKNSSNTLPFQRQGNHAGTTLPDYIYHGGYSMPSLPFSVHDVETMRICTTVDSVGQALKGPPKFCQTTHRFMITKKTDVDLYEGQEFRGVVASTNLKEKTTCPLLSSSTNSGRHDQNDNELTQPSSTLYGESENFGNRRRATSLSNESSSETDIMDMDAFQENYLRGAETSQANKELRNSKSPLLSVSAASSVRKQFEDRLPNKRLLDINERPPNWSTSASLMDNGESSTSKTQTMDVEHLLPNAEQPRFSCSTAPPEDSSKREMDNEWVKRLRPCASESVHDTKSTKKEEDSCDKANQLFSKMKCISTSSEHSRGPPHEQEQLAIAQTTIVKDSDLGSNLRLNNREMILSSPWIRRLCHNRPPPCERNLETAVVHKEMGSKPTLQQAFPSIAAMALMGKTVTGPQPREFIRRGSSLVWNNEGI